MAARSVGEFCEACFDAHKSDCSGFARAVANELKVPLQGLADEIVETLRTGQGWALLPNGVVAAQSARNGKLVIAGLKGSEQAHPDPHGLAHDAFPSAYWGRLGGTGAKDKTINWAWTTDDRDRVSYAAHHL